MSRLQSAFLRLAADLKALQVDWALVGGMAVSVRTRPRTTEDLDVAIAVQSDREAEGVVLAFRSFGYRDLPESVLEPTEVGRLATVRFQSTHDGSVGVVVDLLFASSGIEPEIVAAAEPLEVLPGLIVPVARTEHLLALKILAGREIDGRDARWLWEASNEEEKQRAREALSLIRERRFHRGKDLGAELDRILSQQA